mgnify:CR=1 FL=1
MNFANHTQKYLSIKGEKKISQGDLKNLIEEKFRTEVDFPKHFSIMQKNNLVS